MTDLNNPSASEHQPQVEKSADRNQKRQAGEKPSISARLIQTSADLDRQIEVWKDHEQGVRFLRIGFNLSPIEGALTIDLAAVKNGQATLSQNLPIPGNVVAGVVLENCLEHLGVGSALALLRECRRVLAPEGAMQILTPDMDKILDTLRDGSWRDYREKDSLTTWTDNSSEWLSHAFSHYKCLFNRESLEDLITQVGLVPIPAEENDEHASADRDPNFLEVTCYWPERDSEEEPLVSILVPAYKADYLRETLESALNQSYQNIEVVVCDDSDEEAVAAVVAEFRNDNRIRYVNNEGNIGGRANYLKVFSLAKGEYVKFLNDDDRLHPEAVARMAAILRDRPEIALVTSYRRLIDQDGNALPDRHFNSPIVGEDCRIDGVLAVNALLNACVNYIGEPSTTLFRRRDLEGAKPHIMSYRGRPAPRNGDVTMWVNLLGKGDLVYLVDPLSEFRLHEKQRSKQDEYATRAVEAWRQLYQDAKAAGFLSPDAPQALLAAPLDNVHGVKWAYAIASPQNEAPPAGLEKAAPPQRLSERARPEYPRLVPEKLSLIDLALQRYPIKSLADLGGVWGVDGGYTFYALEHGQLDKMVLVDTKINEAVQARQEDYPQLSLKTGNFGEVDPAQTIGEVDAILLYDVLLHQVKPNWDAVLERYAPHTGHFIIYNQQFIKGDKTQRLLELGAEEYFHNVPHNPTEGFYPDLFNKLDEPHPDHPGRTYRDIHNIWQWGIVDGDLYNKLRELGFVMDFYQDCGQFGRLENFHNHAFLFRKDPEAAAQAPDFPEALAALRAPAPRESESRPKRPGGGKNMKEDWNARAVENARYYVRSTDRNQSEAEFDGSGEQNVREYVLVDRELIAPDGDLRNKRMLEIGCGIGRMTKHLATHFGEVVGIDVSGEMIRQGKSRLADVPNATLLETSGSDLGDFDDNSFDFVFSFIVFQHIPDKAVIFNYIRETMRVLKKGGIFKFQVQGDNSIEYQQVEKDTWMGANISPEEIEALSRELGFEILKTGGLGKQYAWYTVRNTGVRVVPVDENPVFVMGCHRSGTSALSIAIGQHSQATPGPESNYLEFVARGALDGYANGTTRGKHHWLSNRQVSLQEYMASIGNGINEMYRRRTPGKRWVDGTPQYTLSVQLLSLMFPKGSFVQLIRDGRNVVQSMINSGFEIDWASDFRKACRTWTQFVTAGLRFEAEHPERMYRLYNEQLRTDPVGEMHQALPALGFAYEAAVAEALSSDQSVNSSFKDGKKRVTWAESWDEEQRRIFDEESGQLLIALGYEADNSWVETARAVGQLPDVFRSAAEILQLAGPATAAPAEKGDATEVGSTAYHQKMKHEISIYQNTTQVHKLPAIHHFYAKQLLQPNLKSLTGYPNFLDWWVMEIDALIEKLDRPVHVLSLACGNGDTEIRLLKKLKEPEMVILHGYDINPDMIERARKEASEAGITASFEVQDVNRLDLGDLRIDVVLANHSLHHLVSLEEIFATVAAHATPEVIFLVNDMIGRNGHLLWDNAKTVMDEIWQRLPERYRRNGYSGHIDQAIYNVDCTDMGFEGIRAQDILPALLQHFDVSHYLPFGALVNRLIDRVYGPNFDPENEADQALILGLLDLDLRLLSEGKLAPCQGFLRLQAKGTVAEPQCCFQTPEVSLEARNYPIEPSDYLTDLAAVLPKAQAVLPRVSIVIPVYNHLDLTHQCLKAIFNNTDQVPYEIIVVDDGSTDDTRNYLAKMDGKIRYHFNEKNLGFVGACNAGAAMARGEFILFLNNDTEVERAWLSTLVRTMDEREDCGAIGSKLIYPDGTLQEAGGIIFSDGNGWNYGRGGNPNDPRFNFVREVDYCSGAALMVRQSLWRELGGFDTRYSPAYYEDTDLCFGVRSLGYKVFYQPASRVVHHEGKSAGTDLSSGMKRFQVINRDKFVEKWDAELAEQQVNHPANVVKASNRNIIGNIFIADPMFPIFDRASGSLRLFSYIKILREMGYHVTFLARVGDQRLHYAEILRQLGVEVHSNDNKALMAVGLRMEKEVPEIPYKLIFQERFFEYAIMSFWNIGLYYIPLIRQLSPETHIVVDTVDIHFLREKREAELKNDSDLMDQAEKNMRLEIFTYMSADSLWVVTDEDRKAVQPALKDKPIYVVPNIHKEVEVRKSFGETEGLFFVGNYNHLPNVDGVHFFMKEIWPLIQKALPEVPLVLGGQQPPPEIQAYEGDKVAVPGFVESLDEYLTGARVSVSPLRYGAGMKGKIGEALSWGLPVVSTTIGAEGMGLKDETHALIADDPGAFAEAVVRLYQDQALWEQLSQAGRELVETNWSPAAIRRELEKILADGSSRPVGKATMKPVAYQAGASKPGTAAENPERGAGAEQPQVSIVMLSFNALEFTEKCLDAIAAHTRISYEIVLVDNGSDYKVKKALKTRARKDPRIRLINNKKNLGFAGGNNQGVEKASGELVMLLNNDVLVCDGWLESLVDSLNKSPRIGAVGPITNSISGRQMVANVPYSDVRDFPAFAEKVRRTNEGVLTPRRRLAGFAMLMRTELYRELGGFDEAFGDGNFEDDDLCLRIRKAGYTLMVDESTFIHHFGSQTFKANNIDYEANLRERKDLFHQKWPEVDYVEMLEKKNPLHEMHPALLERATEALLTGDVEEAYRILENLVAENPVWPDALYALAVSARELGNTHQALETLDELVGLAPDYAGAYNEIGTILAHAGDLESAKSLFIKAIELENDFLSAQRNYAHLLLQEGDFENGVAALNQILAKHPDDLDTRLDIARLQMEAGHKADARSNLEQVLVTDPDNPEARELLAHVVESGEEPARDVLREALLQAKTALNVGDLDTALAEYGRVLIKNPDHLEALYGSALAYLGEGQLSNARRYLERVSQLEPAFPDAFAHLGNIARQEGKFEEAAAFLENALSLDPQHAMGRLNLADLLLDREQYQEALKLLNTLAEEDPDNTAALIRLGEINLQAGRPGTAREYFERVTEIDEQNGVAQAYLESMKTGSEKEVENE